MEDWQIVLIILGGCLVTLVGSICSAHYCRCSILRQGRLGPMVPMNEQPSQSIREALAQLGHLTEKKTQYELQTGFQDEKCLICLGCFFPSEARTSTSTVVANEVDLEAGDGVTRIQTTTTEATTMESKDRPAQPINDDVLKLNTCVHLFHGRCLVTLFMQKKYNCPICRTPYYQEAEHADEDEDAIRFYPMPPPLPILGFW
ncbi:hypothetical protein F5Y02DRAFT_403524 [Annulohypoxylon stygium]|nr:hypothetical protein F5Y02DRAFT_403524 [Annulohypoxylon stygium]